MDQNQSGVFRVQCSTGAPATTSVAPETIYLKQVAQEIKGIIMVTLTMFVLNLLVSWSEQCDDEELLHTISGECHPPGSQGPCNKGEWLLDKMGKGELKCFENPCNLPDQVFYEGSCRYFHEDAVCGESALGQRLFVTDQGEGVCGCDVDEGWIDDQQGNCVQEFMPGSCSENQVVRIRTATVPMRIIYEGELEDLRKELERPVVTCEENPCGNNQESLAHPKSWDPNSSLPVCHKVKDVR